MSTNNLLNAVRRAIAAARQWFAPSAQASHHLPASAQAIKAQCSNPKDKPQKQIVGVSAADCQKRSGQGVQSRSYIR